MTRIGYFRIDTKYIEDIRWYLVKLDVSGARKDRNIHKTLQKHFPCKSDPFSQPSKAATKQQPQITRISLNL